MTDGLRRFNIKIEIKDVQQKFVNNEDKDESKESIKVYKTFIFQHAEELLLIVKKLMKRKIKY